MTKIVLKVKNLRGHIFGKKIHFGDKHPKTPPKTPQNGVFLDFANQNSLLMHRLFGFKPCTIITFMILPKLHIWQKSGSRVKCKNTLSQSDCKAFKV